MWADQVRRHLVIVAVSSLFCPLLAVSLFLTWPLATVHAQRNPRPPLNPLPLVPPFAPGMGAGMVVVPPPAVPLAPAFIPPEISPSQIYQGDFHLEISESLLQQVLSRKDVSSGLVQDFAQGAVINGQQTTQSELSLDCLPSRESAQFDFVMRGVVNSATTATTPQANIWQQGNTLFQANKRVLLNGENILTQKATVQVAPQQAVMGAQAAPGPLPFFGNLADRIAYRAAMARLPQSNLIAGQKAIEKLQPEIDRNIDSELAEVNLQLRNGLWAQLKKWNVEPVKKAAFSDQTRLYWDYSLTGEPISPLATTEPLPQEIVIDQFVTTPDRPAAADVKLEFHESLFQTVAKKRQLAGQIISLNELHEATDRLLQLIADEVPDQPPQLPVPVNFQFAETNPITAQFADRQLELFLRGTFQAGNLPKTDLQQIRLTVSAELTESQVKIFISKVDVKGINEAGELEEPGITQSAIATQLKTQLYPIILKRKIRLPESFPAGFALDVAQMDASNGWATIELRAATSDTIDRNSPGDSTNAPIPDPTFQPPILIAP